MMKKFYNLSAVALLRKGVAKEDVQKVFGASGLPMDELNFHPFNVYENKEKGRLELMCEVGAYISFETAKKCNHVLTKLIKDFADFETGPVCCTSSTSSDELVKFFHKNFLIKINPFDIVEKWSYGAECNASGWL